LNSPTPRSGLPTIIIVLLGACGGCLLICIVAVVILVNAIKDSTPVALGRAAVLQGQKRYREAEVLLLDAVRKSPNDPTVLNDLAWTYYLDGKSAEGEPYAKRAVSIENSPSNLDTLAHIHLGLKQIDQAEKEFKTVLDRNGNVAESHDGLGQIYESRGHFDKALKEYNRAIALDSSLDGTKERIARLEASGHGSKTGAGKKKLPK